MKAKVKFEIFGFNNYQIESLEVVENPSDREYESHIVNGRNGLANIGDSKFVVMPPYSVNGGYCNVSVLDFVE